MLIGTYEVWLDEDREFRLPEKIFAGLCPGGGKGEVWFAPSFYLRCYSFENVRKYCASLGSFNDEHANRWIRLTATEGMTKVWHDGTLRIPETFCRYFGFKPEQKIILQGYINYIELQPSSRA